MKITAILTVLLSFFGGMFAFYALAESRKLQQRGKTLKNTAVVAAVGIALLLASTGVNSLLVYLGSEDIPAVIKATSGIPISPTLQRIETAIDVRDQWSASTYTRSYPAEPGFRIVEARFEDKGSKSVKNVDIQVAPDGRRAELRASLQQSGPRFLGFKINMYSGQIAGRVILLQQKVTQ
jgi:hypothetical protein